MAGAKSQNVVSIQINLDGDEYKKQDKKLRDDVKKLAADLKKITEFEAFSGMAESMENVMAESDKMVTKLESVHNILITISNLNIFSLIVKEMETVKAKFKDLGSDIKDLKEEFKNKISGSGFLSGIIDDTEKAISVLSDLHIDLQDTRKTASKDFSSGISKLGKIDIDTSKAQISFNKLEEELDKFKNNHIALEARLSDSSSAMSFGAELKEVKKYYAELSAYFDGLKEDLSKPITSKWLDGVGRELSEIDAELNDTIGMMKKELKVSGGFISPEAFYQIEDAKTEIQELKKLIKSNLDIDVGINKTSIKEVETAYDGLTETQERYKDKIEEIEKAEKQFVDHSKINEKIKEDLWEKVGAEVRKLKKELTDLSQVDDVFGVDPSEFKKIEDSLSKVGDEFNNLVEESKAFEDSGGNIFEGTKKNLNRFSQELLDLKKELKERAEVNIDFYGHGSSRKKIIDKIKEIEDNLSKIEDQKIEFDVNFEQATDAYKKLAKMQDENTTKVGQYNKKIREIDKNLGEYNSDAHGDLIKLESAWQKQKDSVDKYNDALEKLKKHQAEGGRVTGRTFEALSKILNEAKSSVEEYDKAVRKHGSSITKIRNESEAYAKAQEKLAKNNPKLMGAFDDLGRSIGRMNKDYSEAIISSDKFGDKVRKAGNASKEEAKIQAILTQSVLDSRKKAEKALEDYEAEVRRAGEATVDEAKEALKAGGSIEKARQEATKATREYNKILEESKKIQKEISSVPGTELGGFENVNRLFDGFKQAEKEIEGLGDKISRVGAITREEADIQKRYSEEAHEARSKSIDAISEYQEVLKRVAGMSEEESHEALKTGGIVEQAWMKSATATREYEQAVKRAHRQVEEASQTHRDIPTIFDRAEESLRLYREQLEVAGSESAKEAKDQKKMSEAVEASRDDAVKSMKRFKEMQEKAARAADAESRAAIENSDEYQKAYRDQVKATREYRREVTKAKKYVDDLVDSTDDYKKSLLESIRATEESIVAIRGLTVINTAINVFGALQSAVEGLMGAYESIVGLLEPGMSFQSTMREVQGIVRGSQEDYEMLTEEVRHIGVSAERSAEGLKILSIAGYNADEALAALPETLKLAYVGGLELDKTASIVTDTLKGFGLEVDQLTRLNDVLVGTITRTNTDIDKLGMSFKYVGPVAKSMGLSIEETSAYLGLLADSGIKASQGGTSLRRALLLASDAAEELGMDKGAKLIDVLKEIKKQQLSTNEVVGMFGKVASTSVFALIDSVDKYGELTETLKGAEGEASALASTMRDTVSGSFLLFKKSIENIRLDIFFKYEDQIKETMVYLKSVVEEHKDDVVGMAGVWIRIKDFIVDIIEKISDNFENVKDVFNSVVDTVMVISKGFWNLAKIVGTVFVVFSPLLSLMSEYVSIILVVNAAVMAFKIIHNWSDIQAGLLAYRATAMTTWTSITGYITTAKTATLAFIATPAGPWIIALGVAAAATAAYFAFFNKSAQDMADELGDTRKEVDRKIKRLEKLKETLLTARAGTDEHIKAEQELAFVLPEATLRLDEQGRVLAETRGLFSDNKDALNDYIGVLKEEKLSTLAMEIEAQARASNDAKESLQDYVYQMEYWYGIGNNNVGLLQKTRLAFEKQVGLYDSAVKKGKTYRDGLEETNNKYNQLIQTSYELGLSYDDLSSELDKMHATAEIKEQILSSYDKFAYVTERAKEGVKSINDTLSNAQKTFGTFTKSMGLDPVINSIKKFNTSSIDTVEKVRDLKAQFTETVKATGNFNGDFDRTLKLFDEAGSSITSVQKLSGSIGELATSGKGLALTSAEFAGFRKESDSAAQALIELEKSMASLDMGVSLSDDISNLSEYSAYIENVVTQYDDMGTAIQNMAEIERSAIQLSVEDQEAASKVYEEWIKKKNELTMSATTLSISALDAEREKYSDSMSGKFHLEEMFATEKMRLAAENADKEIAVAKTSMEKTGNVKYEQYIKDLQRLKENYSQYKTHMEDKLNLDKWYIDQKERIEVEAAQKRLRLYQELLDLTGEQKYADAVIKEKEKILNYEMKADAEILQNADDTARLKLEREKKYREEALKKVQETAKAEQEIVAQTNQAEVESFRSKTDNVIDLTERMGSAIGEEEYKVAVNFTGHGSSELPITEKVEEVQAKVIDFSDKVNSTDLNINADFSKVTSESENVQSALNNIKDVAAKVTDEANAIDLSSLPGTASAETEKTVGFFEKMSNSISSTFEKSKTMASDSSQKMSDAYSKAKEVYGSTSESISNSIQKVSDTYTGAVAKTNEYKQKTVSVYDELRATITGYGKQISDTYKSMVPEAARIQIEKAVNAITSLVSKLFTFILKQVKSFDYITFITGFVTFTIASLGKLANSKFFEEVMKRFSQLVKFIRVKVEEFNFDEFVDRIIDTFNRIADGDIFNQILDQLKGLMDEVSNSFGDLMDNLFPKESTFQKVLFRFFPKDTFSGDFISQFIKPDDSIIDKAFGKLKSEIQGFTDWIKTMFAGLEMVVGFFGTASDKKPLIEKMDEIEKKGGMFRKIFEKGLDFVVSMITGNKEPLMDQIKKTEIAGTSLQKLLGIKTESIFDLVSGKEGSTKMGLMQYIRIAKLAITSLFKLFTGGTESLFQFLGVSKGSEKKPLEDAQKEVTLAQKAVIGTFGKGAEFIVNMLSSEKKPLMDHIKDVKIAGYDMKQLLGVKTESFVDFISGGEGSTKVGLFQKLRMLKVATVSLFKYMGGGAESVIQYLGKGSDVKPIMEKIKEIEGEHQGLTDMVGKDIETVIDFKAEDGTGIVDKMGSIKDSVSKTFLDLKGKMDLALPEMKLPEMNFPEMKMPEIKLPNIETDGLKDDLGAIVAKFKGMGDKLSSVFSTATDNVPESIKAVGSEMQKTFDDVKIKTGGIFSELKKNKISEVVGDDLDGLKETAEVAMAGFSGEIVGGIGLATVESQSAFGKMNDDFEKNLKEFYGVGIEGTEEVAEKVEDAQIVMGSAFESTNKMMEKREQENKARVEREKQSIEELKDYYEGLKTLYDGYVSDLIRTTGDTSDISNLEVQIESIRDFSEEIVDLEKDRLKSIRDERIRSGQDSLLVEREFDTKYKALRLKTYEDVYDYTVSFHDKMKSENLRFYEETGDEKFLEDISRNQFAVLKTHTELMEKKYTSSMGFLSKATMKTMEVFEPLSEAVKNFSVGNLFGPSDADQLNEKAMDNAINKRKSMDLSEFFFDDKAYDIAEKGFFENIRATREKIALEEKMKAKELQQEIFDIQADYASKRVGIYKGMYENTGDKKYLSDWAKMQQKIIDAEVNRIEVITGSEEAGLETRKKMVEEFENEKLGIIADSSSQQIGILKELYAQTGDESILQKSVELNQNVLDNEDAKNRQILNGILDLKEATSDLVGSDVSETYKENLKEIESDVEKTSWFFDTIKSSFSNIFSSDEISKEINTVKEEVEDLYEKVESGSKLSVNIGATGGSSGDNGVEETEYMKNDTTGLLKWSADVQAQTFEHFEKAKNRNAELAQENLTFVEKLQRFGQNWIDIWEGIKGESKTNSEYVKDVVAKELDAGEKKLEGVKEYEQKIVDTEDAVKKIRLKKEETFNEEMNNLRKAYLSKQLSEYNELFNLTGDKTQLENAEKKNEEILELERKRYKALLGESEESEATINKAIAKLRENFREDQKELERKNREDRLKKKEDSIRDEIELENLRFEATGDEKYLVQAEQQRSKLLAIEEQANYDRLLAGRQSEEAMAEAREQAHNLRVQQENAWDNEAYQRELQAMQRRQEISQQDRSIDDSSKIQKIDQEAELGVIKTEEAELRKIEIQRSANQKKLEQAQTYYTILEALYPLEAQRSEEEQNKVVDAHRQKKEEIINLEMELSDLKFQEEQKRSEMQVEEIQNGLDKATSAYEKYASAISTLMDSAWSDVDDGSARLKAKERELETILEYTDKEMKAEEDLAQKKLDLTRKTELEMTKIRKSDIGSALDDSLSLLEDASAKEIDLAEKTRDAKLKMLDLEFKNQEVNVEERIKIEEEFKEESVNIEKETLEKKKGYYEKASAALKTELEKSKALEKSIADDIIGINKSVADAKKANDASVRDLKRSLMSEADAYADQEKEVQEKIREAQKMASIDTAKSIELYKEAQGLAKGLAKEVKEGDKVVQNQAEGTEKAIDYMNDAQKEMEKVAKKRTEELEKALKDTEGSSASLQRALDNANVSRATLEEDILKLALYVKESFPSLNFDTTEASKAVDDIKEKIDEIPREIITIHKIKTEGGGSSESKSKHTTEFTGKGSSERPIMDKLKEISNGYGELHSIIENTPEHKIDFDADWGGQTQSVSGALQKYREEIDKTYKTLERSATDSSLKVAASQYDSAQIQLEIGKKTVDDLVAEYDRLADEIQNVENEIIDIHQSTADIIEGIRTSSLTGEEAYLDKRKQANEAMAKGNEAMARGEFEIAKEYFLKSRDMSADLIQEVQDFSNEILDIEKSTGDKIKALKQGLMSEEEKWMDDRAEVDRLMAEARTQEQAGQLEQAKELFLQAQDMATGLATELKDKDGNVIKSLEETTKLAIDLTEEAGKSASEALAKFDEEQRARVEEQNAEMAKNIQESGDLAVESMEKYKESMEDTQVSIQDSIDKTKEVMEDLVASMEKLGDRIADIIKKSQKAAAMKEAVESDSDWQAKKDIRDKLAWGGSAEANTDPNNWSARNSRRMAQKYQGMMDDIARKIRKKAGAEFEVNFTGTGSDKKPLGEKISEMDTLIMALSNNTLNNPTEMNVGFSSDGDPLSDVINSRFLDLKQWGDNISNLNPTIDVKVQVDDFMTNLADIDSRMSEVSTSLKDSISGITGETNESLQALAQETKDGLDAINKATEESRRANREGASSSISDIKRSMMDEKSVWEDQRSEYDTLIKQAQGLMSSGMSGRAAEVYKKAADIAKGLAREVKDSNGKIIMGLGDTSEKAIRLIEEASRGADAAIKDQGGRDAKEFKSEQDRKKAEILAERDARIEVVQAEHEEKMKVLLEEKAELVRVSSESLGMIEAESLTINDLIETTYTTTKDGIESTVTLMDKLVDKIKQIKDLAENPIESVIKFTGTGSTQKPIMDKLKEIGGGTETLFKQILGAESNIDFMSNGSHMSDEMKMLKESMGDFQQKAEETSNLVSKDFEAMFKEIAEEQASLDINKPKSERPTGDFEKPSRIDPGDTSSGSDGSGKKFTDIDMEGFGKVEWKLPTGKKVDMVIRKEHWEQIKKFMEDDYESSNN